MRSIMLILVASVPFLAAAHAEAASCSAFGKIKSYDAGASTVEVEFTKGKATKFFPRPEGSSGEITKIPKNCKRSALKNPVLPVKATGGKMSVTQVRNNLTGKMMNDTESAEWFQGEVDKLIASGDEVALVLRPGKKRGDPAPLTTIYLPATDEDMAEIARMEAQVSDD